MDILKATPNENVVNLIARTLPIVQIVYHCDFKTIRQHALLHVTVAIWINESNPGIAINAAEEISLWFQSSHKLLIHHSQKCIQTASKFFPHSPQYLSARTAVVAIFLPFSIDLAAYFPQLRNLTENSSRPYAYSTRIAFQKMPFNLLCIFLNSKFAISF